MRIALVNNNYQLGGAETVVRQLHHGFTRRGHKASLHIAAGKKFPREVTPLYPRALSYLLHSRAGGLVNRLFPRVPWMNRSFRALAHGDVDVVHIHSFHGLYSSIESLEYLARRKPVLWTFHRFWGITGGCDHPGACDKYLRECGECPRVHEWPMLGRDNTGEQLALKKRLLTPSPLTIVAPSRHLAERVRHSPVGREWKTVTIPNGINPSEFGFQRKHEAAFRRELGLGPDAITVLIVNRDFKDPLKGYQMIQPALAGWDHAQVQFLFAGKHTAWAVAALPPGVRAVDLGYISSREHLARLYEASDIFLYASPGENFPCVILEAMSAQCCVVSTPTDGVLEQIEHRATGLLAPTFDPADLRRILDEAVSSAELRGNCGRDARTRVATVFSEDKMVEDHLRLYEETLRARS